MLVIRPCHIREAREYVKEHHRHNIPPVGGKFAVACYDGERLCGVAICGIYCAGSFWKNPDGTCDHFEDYAEHRKRLRAERKKGGEV